MQFSNTLPVINLPNMSIPPPAVSANGSTTSLTMINTSLNYQMRSLGHRDSNRGYFKSFRPYHAPKITSNTQDLLQDEFDGKRLRKSVMRKTVDYNSAIIKSLENRIWQRDYRDRRALQPDVIYYTDLLPPPSYVDNPMNAVTTRFVKTATNKMRCPIFCMAWTPEGRRLVTGASSGEFTLWNGLTFNFETILQAHDSPVRTMIWSHNESWMVTGDHAGYVKYWQSNMNNVKMFQAHKEAIRGLSFSPTDHKLASCSDDGTVRIWDFLSCHEERILRGHGADVKCVHWHPQKSLVISGSKDNQQPVKLWDPKCGQSLATLHAHKSTVMDIKWNENGNWLVTASRDHLLKLFDLRNLNQEVQIFRGHKKEASSVAWHPNHEGLFCSGGSDGAILFWHVGADKEVGAIEQAHDSIVWTLAWHPLGHILCSGSNDHTSKFWTRNRPGDLMRDKYNLNTLPAGTGGVDDHEIAEENSIIPGMGPEDRIITEEEMNENVGEIPGLDLELCVDDNKKIGKKVPYSKPIPRNFQAQWNEVETDDIEQVEVLNAFVNQLIETTPGAVPLNDVTPNAIILYGKMIPVEAGSKLAEAISKGTEAINKLVQSGEIEELRNIIHIESESEDTEDFLHDDGEIDFSKVPEVVLPPPLASSKFSQNPELLDALNRGGKQKMNQLSNIPDLKNSEDFRNSNKAIYNTSEESLSGDPGIQYSYLLTEKLNKNTCTNTYDLNYADNNTIINDLSEQDYQYNELNKLDNISNSNEYPESLCNKNKNMRSSWDFQSLVKTSDTTNSLENYEFKSTSTSTNLTNNKFLKNETVSQFNFMTQTRPPLLQSQLGRSCNVPPLPIRPVSNSCLPYNANIRYSGNYFNRPPCRVFSTPPPNYRTGSSLLESSINFEARSQTLPTMQATNCTMTKKNISHRNIPLRNASSSQSENRLQYDNTSENRNVGDRKMY